MSAINTITINDGAATPVAHAFAPIASVPNAIWRDTLAAKTYLASQFSIVAVSKQNTSTKGLSRVKLTLQLPTMGTGVSLPASEVDYTHQVTVEFIMPNRGLKQERKDARVLLANLLADAQVIDMIDELRTAY